MEFIIQFVQTHAAEVGVALIVTSAITLLCLFATFVAKFTKTKRDDDIMKQIDNKWLKFLSWLPSFGISPRHKMLEAALKEALDELEKLPSEGSA